LPILNEGLPMEGAAAWRVLRSILFLCDQEVATFAKQESGSCSVIRFLLPAVQTSDIHAIRASASCIYGIRPEDSHP
jgi:hypothetical protein